MAVLDTAICQGYEAKLDIETLSIISGHLPRRALGLVLDWAELHQHELRANWAEECAENPATRDCADPHARLFRVARNDRPGLL